MRDPSRGERAQGPGTSGVQSVELLLDDVTDAAVRERWARLAEAGLPSQARHTGASNRPHVTLAVRSSIVPALDEPLARAAGSLPIFVTLGGLLVFAHRRCVLSLAVVPSADLLALHARLDEALAGCGASAGHLATGAWTPHVTLARGLTAEQVGAAVQVLSRGGDRTGDLDGAGVAVRRWDAGERRDWVVAPA